eukprot:scaffold28035_cov211-Skeletonema_marinoi.AAC.4
MIDISSIDEGRLLVYIIKCLLLSSLSDSARFLFPHVLECAHEQSKSPCYKVKSLELSGDENFG